jgi:hypothetical protein
LSDKVEVSEFHGLGFSVELDYPELYPQAVMYSLFDADPRPTFKDNLHVVQSHSSLVEKDDVLRRARLLVAWDMFFDHVAGNRVYLAGPKDKVKQVRDPTTGESKFEMTSTGIYISSTRPLAATTKWIISRSHSHKDKAIAWALPVGLASGSHSTIVLTKQNCTDIAVESEIP